ncbi:MAG: transposase, partial [Gemmataceae bacterium]
MSGQAAKVIITERQQKILDALARSRTVSRTLTQRAQIVLAAFQGHKNQHIVEIVGLSRNQVGLGRRRWRDNFERLVNIECQQGPKALNKAIQELLSDAHRAGSPGKFTPEQLAQIIATACEDPNDSGRPVSHWTPAELANEVITRGIVESISTTTI